MALWTWGSWSDQPYSHAAALCSSVRSVRGSITSSLIESMLSPASTLLATSRVSAFNDESLLRESRPFGGGRPVAESYAIDLVGWLPDEGHGRPPAVHQPRGGPA